MANILLIDDDPSVQLLFNQFLTSVGYEVVQAWNGLEGMERLHEKKPDLIITDIMMPEMDGLEILRAVRKEYKSVPVIAISGGMRSAPINFLPHAKLFGACRVFEKPVPLDVLSKAVKELIGDEDGGEDGGED